MWNIRVLAKDQEGAKGQRIFPPRESLTPEPPLGSINEKTFLFPKKKKKNICLNKLAPPICLRAA